MKPEYFDIHCHIDDEKYDADREEVIKRLKESNTWATTIGTDLKSSTRAVEIAEQNEGVFACVGIHPRDRTDEEFDEKSFEILVKSSKTVAVGECGLDYFRFEGDLLSEKKRQKDLFEKQINFAITHNKPLMLHCRDAYGDSLDILEVYARDFGDRLRGNAHFFAGSLDIARRLFEIGFSISFTGVVTFARDYDEIVRFAPRDKILSETDAPYVAPVPFRGKRNEPAYVSYVADVLSEIRGEDKNSFKVQLLENAGVLFGLDCQ